MAADPVQLRAALERLHALMEEEAQMLSCAASDVADDDSSQGFVDEADLDLRPWELAAETSTGSQPAGEDEGLLDLYEFMASDSGSVDVAMSLPDEQQSSDAEDESLKLCRGVAQSLLHRDAAKDSDDVSSDSILDGGSVNGTRAPSFSSLSKSPSIARSTCGSDDQWSDFGSWEELEASCRVLDASGRGFVSFLDLTSLLSEDGTPLECHTPSTLRVLTSICHTPC